MGLRDGRARLLAGTLGWVALFACSDGEADPQLLPAQVDFGEVAVGELAQKVVFLVNTGDADLTVLDIVRGSPFGEALSFQFNGGGTIPPDGRQPITVSFAPTSAGPQTGTLQIRLRDEGAGRTISQVLPLRGVGVSATLTVEAQTVDFGNVVVGSAHMRELAVTNTGAVDATASLQFNGNVRLCADGTSDAAFCLPQLDAPSVKVPAGQMVWVRIMFTPPSTAMETASLVISPCPASQCDIQVDLTGAGVSNGLRCEPRSLDFGLVGPGACLTRTIACQNVTQTTVNVVSWSRSPTTSDDFSVEPPRITVLNENQSVDVDVSYCPQSLGEDEGELIVETNSEGYRGLAELVGSGGGPRLDIFPRTLDFGLTTLLAPTRRTLLITNTGFAPFRITGIDADTRGTGAFNYSLPAGVSLSDSLAPGESVELTIEFAPRAVGPIETNLRIQYNGVPGEQLVRLVGEGIDLPPCEYEIWPNDLAFGVVQRPRSLVRALEIRNTGSNDCLVTSVRIAFGSDLEFTTVDRNSVFIAPGAAATFDVEFSPTAPGTFTAEVEISLSAEPPGNYVRLPVSGIGADSALGFAPSDVDFGIVGVDCAARTRTVQLFNGNAVPVEISAMQLVQPGSAFSLERTLSVPRTILPGETAEIEVGFRAATVPSDYAGVIEIQAQFAGQGQVYRIPLSGSGRLDATRTERFVQAGPQKADVLFVVDHEASMVEEIAELEAGLATMLQYLQEQAFDYQIGVTTTDADAFEAGRLCPTTGSPVNRIVTPNSRPTPLDALRANLPCRRPAGAVNGREGFEAAFRALSPPLVVGHNAGFVRRDASLAVVFVSDGDDRSSQTQDFYFNFFLSIKGFRNPNLFSVSAITGPAASMCFGMQGNAGPAPRYFEMARRASGVWQEICNADWGQALLDIARNTFALRPRFILGAQPILSTIEVVVDGVLIPAVSPTGSVNWTYDFVSNSINFSAFATPEPGAELAISYTAECL